MKDQVSHLNKLGLRAVSVLLWKAMDLGCSKVTDKASRSVAQNQAVVMNVCKPSLSEETLRHSTESMNSILYIRQCMVRMLFEFELPFAGRKAFRNDI